MNTTNNVSQKLLPYPLSNKTESFSVENLLPKDGTPIPTDIIKSLLMNYLCPSDDAKMAQVNCSWHFLIANDNKIKNNIFISSCIAEAKQSAQNMIPAIESLPFEMLDLYESSQLNAFLNIAEVEAQYDINRANPELQAKACLEIAKCDPQHDLTQANQIEQIKNPRHQFKAMLEIAKVDPQYDLSKAKEIAKKIREPFYKTEALIELAKLALTQL